MKANNLLNKLSSYVVPVISLLVVVILVPVVIMPQLKNIAASSKVLNENEGRLDKIESKANKLEELAKNKAQIEENLKFVETVLPINKEVAALVLGIQALAHNSGLAVSSFKIQPGKVATESAKKTTEGETKIAANTPASPTSTKDNLVFNMGLAGELKSLRAFLAALESGKRVITLSQVKSTGGSGANFNFDLFLNAPFSALPTLSADQIGSPLAELTAQNLKLLEDLQTPIFSDITKGTIVPVPTGLTNPFAGK